ncbi:MAG: histidine kinase dimerization/phospho-acceptor domain-containing protein, partial [bacterium]
QNARLFREIEEKGRQLELASRHKSQFLANMSHELRTPLNAILGYTELVMDGIYGEVPEKIRDVLGRLERSGHHLLGLINYVLDLSKIEAGQLTLTLSEYSMKEVVQAVVTAMESLAVEKGLALRVLAGSDLPVGRGDERRIMQVLMNLVGNAVKFTEAGEVKIQAVAADGQFVVTIADTGPGIADADQRRILRSSSRRTVPPRGAGAAPGSASRSPGGLSNCTEVASGWTRPSARARPSHSRCPYVSTRRESPTAAPRRCRLQGSPREGRRWG